MTRLKCICIFATHFHEMATLSHQYPRSVINMKAEVYEDKQQNVTLLYQFVPGVTEKSFGLSIAKMVGFPEDVIKVTSKFTVLLSLFRTLLNSSAASKKTRPNWPPANNSWPSKTRTLRKFASYSPTCLINHKTISFLSSLKS